MSRLRPADLRFLLPGPPGRGAVSGWPGDVAAALEAAGVEVPPAGGDVDVLFSELASLARRADRRAEVVVARGHAASVVLRASGRVTRRLLVRSGGDGPRLVFPLSSRAAVRFVAAPGRAPRVRRLRHVLARVAVPAGIVPGRHVVTVAARQPGPPYLLAAARDAGIVEEVGDWVLHLGEGDDLQRAVFLVLQPDGRPVHAIKFVRHPTARGSLDRDAEGLALAAAAGLDRHVPRLLGRLEVSGTPANVETAAGGPPLTRLLMSGAPEARKREVVDAVAGWLVDVAESTLMPAETLEAERLRLRRSVVPCWPAVSEALVAAVEGVGGVLAHHDLGTWNVLEDPSDGFVVVDWEAARRPALPLWDLVYFLVDALTVSAGPASRAGKTARALALLRGDDSRSPVLHGWLTEAARRLSLGRDQVAALVTLCWLHHGLSPAARAASGGDAASPGHLARIGAHWVADERLGPRWPAWNSGLA